MSVKILHHSIFASDPYGHGGEKRTAQILELLRSNQLEYVEFPEITRQKLSSRLICKFVYAIILTFKVGIGLKKVPSLKHFIRKNYHLALVLTELSFVKKWSKKVYIWESTKPSGYIFAQALKSKGFYIIGMPHNLEALVPGQVSEYSGIKSPHWFMEEIKMLKLCDVVYAISREETLLLNQFGLQAFYLPYYPSANVHDELLKVRSTRRSKSRFHDKLKILMVGSALNTPTRTGMINRISWFQSTTPPDCQLIIAGYGTEDLKHHINKEADIKFYGTLLPENFFRILEESDIVLIHQPPSSGSLTRITEFLFAGIPVLANPESARNFYNLNGVIIYNNDNELNLLLSAGEFTIPDLPVYLDSNISDFITRIKLLDI